MFKITHYTYIFDVRCNDCKVYTRYRVLQNIKQPFSKFIYKKKVRGCNRFL